MIVEMKPVILAGGEGSKMYPLTEEQAKCLLPVGNIPMIVYIVSYLEKYGFQDFIVIVRQRFLADIQQCLNSHSQKNSKFDFVEIPEDDEHEDIGTAEAIALIEEKVKTDLLVLSSDMITNAPLHQLIDIHRTYDASLTAMFSNHIEVIPETDLTATSKSKRKEAIYRDITAIDPLENRLLFFANEADLEQDSITVNKSLLKRYPRIDLKTNRVDCHLFVMKKWLLRYLCTNIDQFESFKSDFVPHVIQKQFSKVKKKEDVESTFLNGDAMQSQIDKKDIHSFIEEDESMKYLNEWSSYQHHCLKDAIKCHAHQTKSFCLRVNTLPAYIYINRQMDKLQKEIAPSLTQPLIHKTVLLNPNVQIGKDCMIGESTRFSTPQSLEDETNVATNEGDKKSKKSQYTKSIIIKRSIMGSHCIIGSNVRITNCILMNHVTVEDGCVLQGSIICNNVTIQSSSFLNNSQVSSGQTVRENSKIENESVVPEEMEFEEDDDDISD